MSGAATLPGIRNLTREQAAERARLLTVHRYDISLDLTDGAGGPGRETFGCRTRIEFDCARPGADTVIELAAARVRSATLNGVPVDTTGWSPERGLALPGLAASNQLVIDAEFAYSTTGYGLHRAVDPVDGEVYVYTHFEPTAAQRVFPCFDQPDLKAEITWHATVVPHWSVVSNMPPVEVVEHPVAAAGAADQQVPGGDAPPPGWSGVLRSVHFAPTPRLSTYLAALCAGPYHRVGIEHDGIELGLWCRRSMAEHLEAEEFLGITRAGFDFFHTHFGIRYPLTKYDQLLVPEYNSGAMENLGAVTFSEELYLYRARATDVERSNRASTILHELAHVWFGDLVTMYWWDDLWLKESFATWAAAWASASGVGRYTGAWTTFLASRKAGGYRADQLSTTHPVYADVPDMATAVNNFDGITYAKGASFLKQFVAYVGIDDFLTGLRAYFSEHLYGNASFADLVRALERSCGRPLGPLTDEWLRTSQVNTLVPEVTVGPDGRYRSVAVRQVAPAEHPTLRTHRIAVGRYDRDGDRLVRRQRWEVEVSGELTGVPELVGLPAGDLLLLNDDDLTYAKIRFDERSLATVTGQLWRIEDPTARALAWNALWDLTRDTGLSSSGYLATALSHVVHEPHVVLLSTALTRIGQVLTEYLAPQRASTGWYALTEAARRALAVAEPGSEQQLIWARTYATAARDAADLAVVRGWLQGRDLPAGLGVDVGLRWHLLHCLVALGAAGSGEIDDELARDATVGGASQAMLARALLPTPAAKEAAWTRLTGADPLPNWQARSLARGFQHPAQQALTAAYADRFFDEVESLWQRRGTEVAQRVVPLLFPNHQVTPEVLAAAERWLAGPDRPRPLRRQVAEGRDALRWALAARARDELGDAA